MPVITGFVVKGPSEEESSCHPRVNGDPEDVCYIYWAPASAGVTSFRGSDEFPQGCTNSHEISEHIQG